MDGRIDSHEIRSKPIHLPRGKTRTKKRRQHDLLVTSEMYLKGVPQKDIAAAVCVSVRQIQKDIVTVKGWWLESAQINVGEAIGREIAVLDNVETAAWGEWERSKERSRVTTVKEAGETFKGPEKRAQTETEEAYGDPKLLEVILRCSGQRAKLLGLNAPVAFGDTDPAARDVPSERELVVRYAEAIDTFAVEVQAEPGHAPTNGGSGGHGPPQ